MAADVEVLRGKPPSRVAQAILVAMTTAMAVSGYKVTKTRGYVGQSEWLMLFGVGRWEHSWARDSHVRAGGKVLLLDFGYFGRSKVRSYVRFSINRDHPQELLDKAPYDPLRWESHGLDLREDADPEGHIVLVGLGRKTRSYLSLMDWESQTYWKLVERFPGRRIVYRPKKPPDPVILPCESTTDEPIEEVLKGASLVVCRHSNVAVDAAVAGVPFECEDGAAMWLQRRPFSVENRLEFVRRLAWFQWLPCEAQMAWKFIRSIA